MSRPPAPLSVVVPVYGAAAALARCVDSLRRHCDPARHALLLVADGPQEAAVDAVLGAARGAGATVLAQPERRGFVAAVNRGLAATTGGDIVLLNSDTEVTAGWLDKLARAATAGVASVTPFSNSATICSLPRPLAANALPAGWSLDAFAALVERVAAPEHPRLPTGVGFCMLVTRAALERVGPFDERRFGLGYGEEVDWCLRASAAGFVHVLDDATFVYHAGQSSFGPGLGRRVRAAHRVLVRRHPEYVRLIAAFLAADPLRGARQRVLDALAATRPRRSPTPPAPRVLHVVHGWPPWSHGGTENYAAGLARRQAERRPTTVLARFANPSWSLGDALELDDRGVRVRLLVNNFTQRDPRSRNALAERRFERDFLALLREEATEVVHVHHLAGLAATLPALARRRGVPVVYQVQDWWTGCARVNLLDAWGRACDGPGLGKCSRCRPLTRLPGAALWNRALYLRRHQALFDALRRADARIAGSQAIVDSFRALGWLRQGDAVHVLPYGVEPAPALERVPRTGGPLRFGFLGAWMPHKGLDVAVAAFAGLDPAHVRLLVYGESSAAPAYAADVRRDAGPAVELRGAFAPEAIEAVYASFDVLVLPSRGLESFGLVAREAMQRGIPVLASRRGALPEIFAAGGEGSYGATFDPDRPETLRAWVERLAAEPDLLARWRRSLPPVVTMDAHAEAVEALYVEVLARRRGSRR